MKRYDLLVLGSGPAGHHAAIQGAKLGKSVAVVEAQSRVGGAGLNTGTIPSKTLREVAISVMAARARVLAGGHSPEAWDGIVHEMMGRCQRVVQKQVEIYRAQFARNRVELLFGTATFLDSHRVQVASLHHMSEVAADTIVIATGTSPARSDKVPIDGHAIVDTDSVPQLRWLPRSMIIVGAGVAGVEYASIFAALGVSVILVDLRPRLLEFVDPEIVEALSYQMRDAGVTLRLGEEVESVALAAGSGVIARMKSRKQLQAETLLYAVGRQGNTAALDLPAAGLQADARGRILVDMNYATAVPHIYAVGDVVGNPGLASVAMEQARLAVCHAFGRPAWGFEAVSRLRDPWGSGPSQRRPDACRGSGDAWGSGPSQRPREEDGRPRDEDQPRRHHFFPYGIYTIPEISFVGQTEAELTAMGVPYEVGIAHYREIARGQIMGDTTGRLKLLFHRETGQLLGVHIIGYGAAELIHIGQAVLNHGGSIEYFVENVFNYPTLAECYKVAALAGANRMAQWATPTAEPTLDTLAPALAR